MKFALKDERGLASLPYAIDLREWWSVWGPKIAAQHGRAGWVLFLMDSQEKIQEVSMLVSRTIRNKPKWDTRGWQPAEWENLEEQAAAAYAWFTQHATGPMRDAPEWAQFLFQAQHDNLAILKRTARELRALQEQGYYVATIERSDGGLKWDDQAAQIAMETD